MSESERHEKLSMEPPPPELAADGQGSPLTLPSITDSAAAAPVVVELSEDILEPVAPRPDDSAAKDQSSSVKLHIAPNVIEIATGTTSAEQAAGLASAHELDAVVHRLLVVGLAISTALMLIGLALDLLLQREMPTVVPDLGEVWTRVLAIRPSGFLALGLLALIATPIIRVIGSVIIFAYERDWRFALITLIVLAIVTLSLLLGRA
jgi:uncharacterized membrane protein